MTNHEIPVNFESVEISAIGKLGKTFKLSFGSSFAGVGIVQAVLKSTKGSSGGYKSVYADKEGENRVYMNSDKNPFQRRSAKLLSRMRNCIKEFHPELQVQYDVTSGVLTTSGDSPQQLMKISIRKYNDPPGILKNANMSSWMKYNEIISMFKEQLSIPPAAVWCH